jgi:hypothetical protein
VQDSETVSGRSTGCERVLTGVAANRNWVHGSPLDNLIVPMMETAAFHGLEDDAVIHGRRVDHLERLDRRRPALFTPRRSDCHVI